jgi:hypothetical protein
MGFCFCRSSAPLQSFLAASTCNPHIRIASATHAYRVRNTFTLHSGHSQPHCPQRGYYQKGLHRPLEELVLVKSLGGTGVLTAEWVVSRCNNETVSSSITKLAYNGKPKYAVR